MGVGPIPSLTSHELAEGKAFQTYGVNPQGKLAEFKPSYAADARLTVLQQDPMPSAQGLKKPVTKAAAKKKIAGKSSPMGGMGMA